MKGSLSDKEKNGDDLNNKIVKILPKEFEVLKIVSKGRDIIINMKELMEIANCENKAEIMAAMNRASTNLFYFGRVVNDLKHEYDKAEEDFEIWMAARTIKDKDSSSEKARERKVMVDHEDEYRKYKKNLRIMNHYLMDAGIAYKSLERCANLLSSIGAMVRSDDERSRNKDPNFKED